MNRVSYKELKQWFFEDAYLWCQRKFENGKVYQWGNSESEWGALDTYENSFEKPIENLMIYVIYIILRSGRNPYSHNLVLNDIYKILSKYELNKLLLELEEEKQDFLYDLDLVLNNREIEE
ncbi:hypothetical protein BKK56_05905 [Rodentibacter genomosp. 2]|uniref:hypothetical protein n=1 Tax=Rodentibacter genomosp. 2 TaxID=1908266 RepID=UPI000984970E|nr:hypothetical protein BKK56_05905 [Rodentibacter genomosp. 2]